MTDGLNYDRRRLLGTATMRMAAAGLGMIRSARAQSSETNPAAPPKVKPGPNASLGPLKQIDAGPLNVGYVDVGPASGPAVILLHGWPYDIHSFVDVASWRRRGTGRSSLISAAMAQRAFFPRTLSATASRRPWPSTSSR